MAPTTDFFRELDALWNNEGGEALTLQLIGASALMLQTDYTRGTKDSDVLETAAITPVRSQLLKLAGQNSALHTKHRIYLEFVSSGLPLLPHGPRWVPLTELNRQLTVLNIEVLTVVDVVVSKLKRLHGDDLSDIRAMIDLALVPHAELIKRFRSAVDVHADGAAAEDIPRFIQNLHTVERDLFGVPESHIDLPSWVRED